MLILGKSLGIKVFFYEYLVVHEDGERTLVVLEDVLAGGAAADHSPRPAILGHGEVGLDQAELAGLAFQEKRVFYLSI